MADGRTPPPTVFARSRRGRAAIGEVLRIRPVVPLRVEVSLPAELIGGKVDLIANGEVVDSQSAAAHLQFERPPGQTGYVRIHVYDADGAPRAVTNPIYIEPLRPAPAAP